ncbi:hypothetical protein C8F01DRAFT_1085669 [Mycena amicta]|nr:hypothetical protein C8F01DRAFT_1085669 [Mycena amicta]
MLRVLSRAVTLALLAQTTLALVPVRHTTSGAPVFVGPSGSRLTQSGSNLEVFAPNGTLVHLFQDVIPNVKSKRASQPTLARRQVLSSTEAYVQLGPTDVLQSFNATFVVPPAPTSFESQIMYFSANIQWFDENGALFANLRAALQYGGSFSQGGPFWTYALQLELLPNNGFFEISAIGGNSTLDVGQRLDSVITQQTDDSLPDIVFYSPSFPNLPNPFQFGVGLQSLPQIVALQMEEEGVTQDSDYPQGSLVFESVNVNLTSGAPTLSWNTSVDPALMSRSRWMSMGRRMLRFPSFSPIARRKIHGPSYSLIDANPFIPPPHFTLNVLANKPLQAHGFQEMSMC